MDNYILHLETATKVCSVALSKNGKLIALKESAEENYTHGENLNLFIIDVLNQGKIGIDELSAVSVASGPGSYTGLRIGAATAKALCYAKEIPLIAIDALKSLAWQASQKYVEQNLCAVIDARRLEVYNLITDSNLNNLKDITADIIDENTYSNFTPFVCFGDGSEKLKDIWVEKDCIFDSSIKSSAAGQVELAFQKFNRNEFEDVAYWEPFYLKDFIAGKKQ